MKKKTRAAFEVMDKIFEETHYICTKENSQKWNEELIRCGWTDAEFDEELNKRINEKKIA